MSVRDQLARARLGLAGSVLAAGALLSMAAPADAAPAAVAMTDDVSPAALAPACVTGSERSDWFSRYADIRNGCSRTYRVKAIIAFSWDGPCVTLDSGESYTHTYSLVGRLDRIDLC